MKKTVKADTTLNIVSFQSGTEDNDIFELTITARSRSLSFVSMEAFAETLRQGQSFGDRFEDRHATVSLS